MVKHSFKHFKIKLKKRKTDTYNLGMIDNVFRDRYVLIVNELRLLVLSNHNDFQLAMSPTNVFRIPIIKKKKKKLDLNE